MQPTDCRALLTGASGGIGLALAERLASAGAHLLLVGRRLEPLQPLLQRFPQNVKLVQADIASRSGRDALVAAAQNFGGLNCLINARRGQSFRPARPAGRTADCRADRPITDCP